MTHVKQLAHICLSTTDLSATERFFAQALGVHRLFAFHRAGDEFGFYLNVGGRTHVEVFRRDHAEHRDDNAINHLCLEVDDLEACIAQIRTAGYQVSDRKLGVDGTWQAWTQDPGGARIELFEYTAESAQFTGGDREADW